MASRALESVERFELGLRRIWGQEACRNLKPWALVSGVRSPIGCLIRKLNWGHLQRAHAVYSMLAPDNCPVSPTYLELSA